MNTLNQPKNTARCNTLVLNSLSDVVEIQLIEELGPTLVDLNQVFGATNYVFLRQPKLLMLWSSR